LNFQDLSPQAFFVEGVEFNDNPDLAAVLNGLRWSGFQASHLGKAIEQINEMVNSKKKLFFFFVKKFPKKTEVRSCM
jgi:deoxyhypusine synthase